MNWAMADRYREAVAAQCAAIMHHTAESRAIVSAWLPSVELVALSDYRAAGLFWMENMEWHGTREWHSGGVHTVSRALATRLRDQPFSPVSGEWPSPVPTLREALRQLDEAGVGAGRRSVVRLAYLPQYSIREALVVLEPTPGVGMTPARDRLVDLGWSCVDARLAIGASWCA